MQNVVRQIRKLIEPQEVVRSQRRLLDGIKSLSYAANMLAGRLTMPQGQTYEAVFKKTY